MENRLKYTKNTSSEYNIVYYSQSLFSKNKLQSIFLFIVILTKYGHEFLNTDMTKKNLFCQLQDHQIGILKFFPTFVCIQ